jgi:hypothetical protein
MSDEPEMFDEGMQAEEEAYKFADFVIAKLEIEPGDTLTVRAPGDYTIEDRWHFFMGLRQWAEREGVDIHFLVLPHGSDIAVLHNVTIEQLSQAGGADFPGWLGGVVGAE